MKFKPKKTSKILSDKIADALTVTARPDIEDDSVFGTKPKIVSRGDFTSSDSEDDAAISDFRRRNVNLLSELSKKYEGEVVSRKKLVDNREDEESDSEEETNNITLDRTLVSTSQQNGNDSDVTDSSEDEESAEKVDSTNVSDSEDFSSDEGESDDYSITKFQRPDSERQQRSRDEETTEEEGEGIDMSTLDEPVMEDFNHMTKQNVSEESKKGVCVRNQLLLWESLLEMRIHLQRCMNNANRMPILDTYNQLNQNTEFSNAAVTARNNVLDVLDKLVTLQNLLLKKNPETKSLAGKNEAKESKQDQKAEESDEEIPSDTDNEEIPSDTEEDEPAPEKVEDKPKITSSTKKRKLEDFEKELSITHKAFKSFRDTTIQKWHDKTRLATAANIKTAPTNTVLQQISYILSDKEKLVKRTQLKRTEYDIIGYKKESPATANEQQAATTEPDRKIVDEYIPEIFDDSDFYHQLLRELIECKSADISDPVQLSRQWIALQQMRSKMKRKVDTKATKGRKIKYVVHNQLINFMAPERGNQWSDESANELFSSLFGKMFETNNVGVDGVFDGTMKIYN